MFEVFVYAVAIVTTLAFFGSHTSGSMAPITVNDPQPSNDTTVEPTPVVEADNAESEDVWFDFQPIATYDYACPLTCELPRIERTVAEQQEYNYEYYMALGIRELKKLASTHKVKGYGKMPKVRLASALATITMSYE